MATIVDRHTFGITETPKQVLPQNPSRVGTVKVEVVDRPGDLAYISTNQLVWPDTNKTIVTVDSPAVLTLATTDTLHAVCDAGRSGPVVVVTESSTR
jgi:hypothetical protein